MMVSGQRRFLGLAMLVATLVLVFMPLVLVSSANSVVAGEAETATADEPEDGGGSNDAQIPDTVLGLLWNSGICGYIIIILSIVLVGTSIETFFSFKPDKLLPEDLLAEIEETLDDGEYEQALEVCQTEDVFLSRIIGAGLGKMANGFERMEEAIGDEAEAQATFLHQKLGYINLIATIAPMLGLLGTVSGMVTAFGTIARNPMATAQQLAGGIYVALTTTLLGLVVAIPGTVIFTFLRNRSIKTIMDMGIISGEILDRFRDTE